MKKKPTYEELEKRVQELTQNQKKYELIQEVADIGSRNWNITKDNKPIRFAGTQHNIIDKVHAEELLQESEEKYRTLVESINDVIVQLSPAGKLLYVSPNVKEFGGYDPKIEIGNDMSKYFANDTDIIRAVALLEKVSETHQTGSFEFLFKAKDKKPFYVEITCFPILKENKVTAIQLVLRDITQRKESEAALKKASREWILAMDAFEDIIYLLDNDRCLVRANSAFYKSMDVTPDKAIGRHIVEIVHPRGEDKPCPVCLAQEEKRDFVMIMEADEPNNPVGRPIEITVKTVRNEDGTPSGILMNLHDLTTSRAAEQKLLDHEKQLSILLNATQDIAFLAESDGTFLAVNNALAKSLGVKKEELVNHSMYGFISREDAEKRKLIIQKGIESKKPFQWKDDRAGQYFDNSVYPIFDDKGDVKHIAVFIRDITAQVKADETLRQYEHIISATNDHMSFLDRDYTYLAVNDAYLIAHKKERSQIIGHTVSDLLSADVFDQFVKEKFDRCLAGEEIHYQEWFDFPGLGLRYMDVAYYSCTGSDRKISGVVVSSRDITQRKQAEDMLIEKTMYLDNILQSSTNYAIATTDLNFCITYYNPLAEEFFGYTAKEVIGKTVQEMHTREHVDSKRFDEAIEIIRTRGEYCYRLKQETDTGTRYLDSRVTGIYDNARNLVGFALFSHDITTRIKAEQELKYSKLQLEAVFNNLDSVIFITDMDSCKILYMNDYMKKVLGRDCTGKICWKSFYNNQDGPCDFCTNDKLIDAGGNPKEPYVWEFFNEKAKRWYELHAQAINWTEGRLVRMTIAIDITERKQAQEKINASLKEKVVLLREIHHRVKNNMQVILSLLRMYGRRINDANLSKVFEDCRDRINAMSLIHESLYQSDDLAKIDFKVYLQKLCQNLSTAYGASGKGIKLTVGECNVALDMDQSIAIGMVIAELISNAFKYAFPLGKGGNVSISLSEIDAENVKLIIKDDGKGMPLEIDIMNSSSLGLRLAVSAVTMELGGSIEVERDQGTQFTICFKYKRK